MPRKIIGPRNEKVAGGWRNLHRGDRNDLYCSPYLVIIIIIIVIIICLLIRTCLNIHSVGTITHLFIRDIPATFLCCKTFSDSLLNCIRFVFTFTPCISSIKTLFFYRSN